MSVQQKASRFEITISAGADAETGTMIGPAMCERRHAIWHCLFLPVADSLFTYLLVCNLDRLLGPQLVPCLCGLKPCSLGPILEQAESAAGGRHKFSELLSRKCCRKGKMCIVVSVERFQPRASGHLPCESLALDGRKWLLMRDN